MYRAPILEAKLCSLSFLWRTFPFIFILALLVKSPHGHHYQNTPIRFILALLVKSPQNGKAASNRVTWLHAYKTRDPTWWADPTCFTFHQNFCINQFSSSLSKPFSSLVLLIMITWGKALLNLVSGGRPSKIVGIIRHKLFHKVNLFQSKTHIEYHYYDRGKETWHVLSNMQKGGVFCIPVQNFRDPCLTCF